MTPFTHSVHHVDDSLLVTADQFAKGLPVSLLGLGDQFGLDFCRWMATHFSDYPLYSFNVAAHCFIRWNRLYLCIRWQPQKVAGAFFCRAQSKDIACRTTISPPTGRSRLYFRAGDYRFTTYNDDSVWLLALLTWRRASR
jgi:hypothetical protein